MRESLGVLKVAPTRAVESVRWLRLLVILSIAVPLFIYLIVGVVRYMTTRDEAAVRVSRSLRVAHEHASKVLAASEAIQEKVHALVNGRAPEALRRSEPSLHEALRARTVDQPQIQSILILDAEGKTVASSRLVPFPPIDLSDGEYFRVHASGQSGAYISKPIVTRTSNEKVLNLSVPFNTDRGEFGGVINVTLLSTYFNDFYSDLAAEDPGLSVSLFREGGEIYARWPSLPEIFGTLSPNGPVMESLTRGEESGQMRGVSSLTGDDSLIAYRKIGAYPLYVGSSVSLTSLRKDVIAELGALLALGAIPVAALFFAATIALGNARNSLLIMESLQKEIETRRRAEEALLQAQKLEALGRLTGGVAHDFNNALMVISNNLHLIKRTAPEIATKQIESIGRAVKSATNLTRQLLAFSRRQPLVAEHVILQEKLPSIKDLIGPALGSQIRLEVLIEPDTAPVTLDMAELELALLNLAINARDAMPQGGSVYIHARNSTKEEAGQPSPLMVVIDVLDTGSGIPPELLNKVFEPFFTTKAIGHGTGLGLSQVYGMCQRLNGRAEISSELGKGTRIRLLIPSAATLPSVQEMPTPSLTPLHKKLLLVEDNEDVAASLIPILESLGCTVTHVDRADKARKLLDEGSRPDLILSDVVMPGAMNGVDLARHIRSSWPDQPLLLMTGYAEQLDHIKSLGFDVLPKPSTPHMLYAALVKLVK